MKNRNNFVNINYLWLLNYLIWFPMKVCVTYFSFVVIFLLPLIGLALDFQSIVPSFVGFLLCMTLLILYDWSLSAFVLNFLSWFLLCFLFSSGVGLIWRPDSGNRTRISPSVLPKFSLHLSLHVEYMDCATNFSCFFTPFEFPGRSIEFLTRSLNGPVFLFSHIFLLGMLLGIESCKACMPCN